jgi:hypothetical protein
LLSLEEIKMRAIVEISRHYNDTVITPKVEILTDWLKPFPLQTLTESELNSIPEVFRCFVCLGKYSKKHIGGIHHHQRICSLCFPLISEWAVGRLILFDLKHSQYVEGYGQEPKRHSRTRVPELKPEEYEAARPMLELALKYTQSGQMSESDWEAIERRRKENGVV